MATRRADRQARAAWLAAGLWLGGAFGVAAQELPAHERRNAFYAELGGSGLMTANYERDLSRNASLRVGGGAVPMVGALDIVVMPSLSLGTRRHRFGAGVGIVAVRYEDGRFDALPTAEAAYQFRNDVGFVFRAALAWLPGGALSVLPGVSVGWSF